MKSKYGTLADLERNAAHDSCAFMWYFLGRKPYQCQIDWGKRLDNDEIQWEADFEPRDHGKSELFVISYPLRRICLNPNIRVLIVKNTKDAAIKAVSAIKTQLEVNERIKAFYQPYWQNKFGLDDICNAGKLSEGQGTWQADKIYVKRTVISQDPTLEAVGMGGAITGGHYDIIILDDAEDPSRLKSDQAYLDQIDWYLGTILQLREPWTKIIVVGTFKRASGDMYEVVRKNPLYSVSIQSAILTPKLEDISYERVFDEESRLIGVKDIRPKRIKVLCPEKWNIERLIMDREGAITPGMNTVMWRREKMNDLSAFEENIFKRPWFTNRYDPEECKDIVEESYVRPFFKAIISGWDTAHTDEKTNSSAAFSVGCSVGIGDNGYYLLPHFFRQQIEFPKLREQVVLMYLLARPNAVLIEYKDTGIALVQELRRPYMFRGQNVSIPLIAYEPDRDKVARANATTPVWESGLVWLPKDCELNHQHKDCVNAWLPGWIERHIDFPESTWKDDVDVFSMLINYAQRVYPLNSIKNELPLLEETAPGRLSSRAIPIVEQPAIFGRVPRRLGSRSRVSTLPGFRGLPSSRKMGGDE